MGVSIRTLKRNLGIGRAATFRNFLNCFEIDNKKYEEFAAATVVSEDLAKFLSYNQFFIKEFERDYYSNRNAKEIASKIGRKEEEIFEYLKQRGFEILSQDHTVKYISAYRIDWKLGGNYEFLNLLREVSKKC